jgi:hypothetical protein
MGRNIVGFRVQAKLNCTVKEELRLEVFDEMQLKRTFGSETEEVKGGWRKVHSEEPRRFCCDRTLLR